MSVTLAQERQSVECDLCPLWRVCGASAARPKPGWQTGLAELAEAG